MLLDPVSEYDRITHWIGPLVNKEITPKEFARKLNKHLNSLHAIRVRLIEADPQYLDKDDFSIGAEYDPDLDEQGKKQIIINLFVNHPKSVPWLITDNRAQRFVLELVEALVHEYQHLDQYRSRNFKLQKEHFISEHSDSSIRNEQEYLGNPDEIDAYAANIATRLYLLDTKLNISTDKDIWHNHSLDLNNYIKTFGSEHTIVNQLCAKIESNLQFLKDIDNGKIRRKTFPRPRDRRV